MLDNIYAHDDAGKLLKLTGTMTAKLADYVMFLFF